MTGASNPVGEIRGVAGRMLDVLSRLAPHPAGSSRCTMQRLFVFTAAQSGLFEDRTRTARKPGWGREVFYFLGYDPEG